MRSPQRRRQFPAGAALSSAARAVPERCGRLVWRGTRPCHYHAHQPGEPDGSHDPDDSYQSGAVDKLHDTHESRDVYQSDDLNHLGDSHDPDHLDDSHEPVGSRQRGLTTKSGA